MPADDDVKPEPEIIPPNPNPVTRFKGRTFGGDGADPKEAQAKSREKMKENNSVRQAMRRIACHQFDTSEDAKPLLKQIQQDIFPRRTMTGAQLAAITRFTQALKNWKAMQNVVEDIDGKLIEKKVEAKIGYAELVAGSMDDGETVIDGGAEPEKEAQHVGGDES
jgi:hypothetical protein